MCTSRDKMAASGMDFSILIEYEFVAVVSWKVGWLWGFFLHKICTRRIGRLVSQFYSSLGCFYPSGTTGWVVSSNTIRWKVFFNFINFKKWWINEGLHRSFLFDKPLQSVYQWHLKYLTQRSFLVIAQWLFIPRGQWFQTQKYVLSKIHVLFGIYFHTHTAYTRFN